MAKKTYYPITALRWNDGKERMEEFEYKLALLMNEFKVYHVQANLSPYLEVDRKTLKSFYINEEDNG